MSLSPPPSILGNPDLPPPPSIILKKALDYSSCLFRMTYRIAEKFHKEKIFTNFTTCLNGRNFYPANFLSRIEDYTEDMATFTILVKIYSSEYFCSARVAGIGEIFVQRKFSAIRYCTCTCIGTHLLMCDA